jgi:hypothetical protein
MTLMTLAVVFAYFTHPRSENGDGQGADFHGCGVTSFGVRRFCRVSSAYRNSYECGTRMAQASCLTTAHKSRMGSSTRFRVGPFISSRFAAVCRRLILIDLGRTVDEEEPPIEKKITAPEQVIPLPHKRFPQKG